MKQSGRVGVFGLQKPREQCFLFSAFQYLKLGQNEECRVERCKLEGCLQRSGG